MQLFFHHVGKHGAAEDFPKTVYRRIPITVVEDHVPNEVDSKKQLLDELQGNFPDGWFNCWGVPTGASPVIRNLTAGDCVLLLETTAEEGPIPALCLVKSFPKMMLPALSQQLWGDAGFPYIFFFATTLLNYNWQQFCADVGYKPNYDPRGHFQKVADSKILGGGWDGVSAFVTYLLNHYPGRREVVYEHIKENVIKEAPSKDEEYTVDTKDEINQIYQLALSPPTLIDESQNIPKLVAVTPRDAAFRGWIREMYGRRCAVCQLALVSPNGTPEVQSAHIYPKAKKGSDDPRNGICLCRLHHWAFDVGWFSISDDLTIIVRDTLPQEESYNFLLKYLGRKISAPLQEHLAPAPLFLSAHRNLHGFD